MALPIISAEERLKEQHSAKIGLIGFPGTGKTTQLKTLPADKTLFVDLEAGDLSVKDWTGDTVRPRSWSEFRDLVVFLAGPLPTATLDQSFSEAHYRHVCEKYGDPGQLAKYEYYFVDSLTVLSRLCFAWCKTQPQAYSEKNGKPDTRGAYGLLGQEMIAALTHLQHVRDKHVIYVAILEEKMDDFNRRYYQLQLEGSKTALELPGILDEVVTLAILKADDGSPYRAFITRADNPYGYPSKDRSGRLDAIEEPYLGRLIQKCLSPTPHI
ncbi:ATP-binding protein [Nitrosomonas communis]|uniref:AAA domain-containing protein n=1 Tax=Nitrosomonas communis TaxID=44574 RepID=A0A1I4LNC4_9PROT|nr:ATP-binding protein [Nitrosomonas communis]SFL92411.1 AAA domain-containing protein [Nitrosomonas communis]